MKSMLIILGTVILLSYSNHVFAHEGMTHEEGMESMDHQKGSMMKMQSAATQANSKAVEVGNKFCPVTGNPVNDGKMGEAIKYEHNGKVYNLCCKMCAKDFKKNPKKYSKMAEDEVAKEKMMKQKNKTK